MLDARLLRLDRLTGAVALADGKVDDLPIVSALIWTDFFG